MNEIDIDVADQPEANEPAAVGVNQAGTAPAKKNTCKLDAAILIITTVFNIVANLGMMATIERTGQKTAISRQRSWIGLIVVVQIVACIV